MQPNYFTTVKKRNVSVKVIKKKNIINPYGGINAVIKSLRNQGISKLINDALGKRPTHAKYSFSDVILGLTISNLCSDERLHDAESHKYYFKAIPGIKYPSHDTFGRVIKKLATEETGEISSKGVKYQFCINRPLNDLLIKIAVKLRTVDISKKHTLDYDNTIIFARKYDTTRTYKGPHGYQPGVSFIEKIPVYVEGRTGNALASFRMVDTLKRTFEGLDKEGIKINRFRSDAAAYQKQVISLMEKRGIDFFIRAKTSSYIHDEVFHVPSWSKVATGNTQAEVADIIMFPFGGIKPYRAVVSRIEDTKNGIFDHKHDKMYKYRAILTNNYSMSAQEVFDFYNQRGEIEINFDILGNDFNWKRCPFSFLNENTSFIIISAIILVLFEYLRNKFCHKMKILKHNFELKRFIKLFIAIPVEWYDNKTIFLYSNDNKFKILME